MSNLETLYRNHIIWARFRRLMLRMAIGTVLALALAFYVLWRTGGPMPIHFVIAISLGIFCMVMLTGALMGLSFVSSSTGHDDDVIDPTGNALDRRPNAP
jgi:uncharacterized membrane protein